MRIFAFYQIITVSARSAFTVDDVVDMYKPLLSRMNGKHSTKPEHQEDHMKEVEQYFQIEVSHTLFRTSDNLF